MGEAYDALLLFFFQRAIAAFPSRLRPASICRRRPHLHSGQFFSVPKHLFRVSFFINLLKILFFITMLKKMQIGCALIGSLGALYNGVLLINLGIALFALVAIESSSQKLGRTYAVLLFCSLLLDVSWFILFTHEIWSLLFLTHFSFSTALQF